MFIERSRDVVASTVLLFVSGCAAAYHDYPHGCAPYSYCPPPPLPHVQYHGCPAPLLLQKASPLRPLPAPEAEEYPDAMRRYDGRTIEQMVQSEGQRQAVDQVDAH